jgi:hydrogenase expression/formation protein HypE
VEIVTGDTKVIERRSDTPGLFINTSGVGRLWPGANVGLERVSAGDSILVNGSVAEHGLAIMSVRNGLEFETTLRSDSAPLNHLIGRLLSDGVGLKFCRDATRGGVAGVLADISEASGLSLEIDERRIPITPTARHAAEMLGLDPLAVANEGKAIFVVAGKDCDRALRLIRADDRGRNAAKIGIVSDSQPPLVELITRHAGRRIVQRPYGEELPRIC